MRGSGQIEELVAAGQFEPAGRHAELSEIRTHAEITEMAGGAGAAPPLYDASYQAILDYATGQGWTLPSESQRTKQNQLVVDLKGYGIWDELDIFYNFATDGDSNFSRINWKSPGTFTCTLVGAPVFTTNQGWQSNAPTSNNLLTAWTPSTNGVNLTLNDASLFGWVNTEVALSTAIDFGTSNVAQTGFLSVGARNTASNPRMSNNSAVITGSPGTQTTSIGLFHSDRFGSLATDFRQIVNGVVYDSSNNASVALPDQPLRILAGQSAGGAAANGSTRRVSMVGAGASLYNLGLHDDLYTAWNTYFTSL